jgi:hypothetical protein
MRKLVAHTVVILLLACAHWADADSDVRIDNSSLETFHTTWDQLYQSLSRAERRNLENALVRIAFAPYRSVTEVPPDLLRGPIVPETIRDQIAGMNYAQIIELSEKSSIRVER